MNKIDLRTALGCSVAAAHRAGELMQANLNRPKKINSSVQHDIKLELDVRCQKVIEESLSRTFPKVAVLGEEGSQGEDSADIRWVVDPIDGTVNFTYGIPHACVSIALQTRKTGPASSSHPDAAFETVAGVVLDPFASELWTAIKGQPARLNGKPIRVSTRRRLDETILSLGFSKNTETLNDMLGKFNHLIHRVRKIRIMGAAALALVYVATGRFDGYWESGIRLWDIAAGGLILECAGGEFWRRAIPGEHTYEMIATNGLLRKKLIAATKT